MKALIVRILRLPLIVYLLMMAGVFFGQREMLYHPLKSSEPQMIAEAKSLKLAPLKNAQGTIIGWQSDAAQKPRAANRLLVFNGNAANALDRQPYVEGFESLDGGRQWEVTLFEYPGYGARPGNPSRKEFTEAARAAIAQLTTNDNRPLYLLGESLGSGVACEMAADQPDKVRGVILVTPYARLADVAQATLPFLPSRFLLRDRWDNVAALEKTHDPVAILIAGHDEVVGSDQGEQLFASLGDRAKHRWFFPTAGHNGIDVSPVAAWFREVSAFLLEAKR
jgi:pimeloyl-ACP methyl ester carboxylesterase